MRRSRTTFRLEGVEEDKTLENIKQEANEYLKGRSARSWLPRSSKTTAEEQPRDSLLGASLAQQCGSRTATITFGSEQLKKLYKKRKGSKEGSDLDDEFRGMTVLHQGCNEEPEIDICAVHGLDGHAFDTWMADTKMWLRDHLPHHPEFRRCRVMTYGYNSALSDKTSMATQLSDLADGLLMSLGNHRSTDGERSRPLLLICHSMGGIVARLAMTQYHRWGTQKYTGVALGHCGLLLLSTPNAGSKLADWPDLMVALAGVVAGVRGNLVDELRIFNGKTGQQVNDWMKIPEPRPMIRCFCEESLTGSYQVVTTDSAGFLENTATMIHGTNHHTVCKFERDNGEAWRNIIGCLCEMKAELVGRSLQVSPHPVNVS